MAEQVNGIGLDVDNGLFEVGATLPQAGSWSIGCDVTIEDVDASIQEVRVNDISLSGSLAIPEVSVDIDANNDKVMDLEIGIATSGLSTGITESQIVPYNKIVKITEFSPESINERKYASSALAAKRIYDLIKEGGAGLNEDELKAFLKRYGYVTEEYVNELLKNASNFFYLSEDGQSIGTPYNIFSEKEISANGLGVGSGGSGSGEGGGLIRTVLTSSSLGSVTSNDNFTTFNAFAIDSIYKKVKSIEEGNVSLSNYYTKSESDARFALLSSLTTVEEKIREILSWFTIDENGNLRTEFNLYSTKEISAGGFNGTGGSTGGGLISTVLGIDKFGTVTTNSNTSTFNAYAIDSLHKRIKNLEESEVDLTGYATEEWVIGRGFITASALAPYLKTTDFETWKTSSFNPVVSQVNTNKNNIAEILKWFAIDGDGNLYTTYNFYSTKEISSGGFDSGSNGTGGLIGVVYGKSSFGTIANEANNATFNAYAIDSLYKRIVSLENKEVDLTGYATEAWVAGQGFITSAALSPYMKTADANDTFATKTALNNLSGSHDSLATRVSTAEGNIGTHTTQISGLTTRMGNAETNISTNAKGIADNKTAIATNKNNISANATAITNLGKKVTANEGNIAKILKWFAEDSEGNLCTKYNFYSTKEISANGLSIGSGGSGGGLISQVYGTTAFGTIAAESNSATFNAYAIDSLYKRIVSLEGKATAVSFVPALTSGKQIGTLSIDGVSTVLYGVDAYSKADADGRYLKLTGGEINGYLNVSHATQSIALGVNSKSTDYVAIRFTGANGNSAYLVYSGNGDEWAVTPPNWAGSRILLHSNNFGDYAISKAGGTITKRNDGAGLSIVAPDTHWAGILFRPNTATVGGTLSFNGTDWRVTDDGWNKAYTLYHTGNFNPANYLPLTGGSIVSSTIGCPLYLANTKETWNVIGFKGNSHSDYAYFGLRGDGSFFVTGIGWNGTYNLIHSNNYSQYALPLSGGTISGGGSGILTINRTSGTPLISFQANGTNVGFLGIDTVSRPCFVDPVYYETNYLIHSGNYNSYALPLSGGTVKNGDNGTPLVIDTTHTEIGVPFRINNINKGWVGHTASIGTYLYDYTSKKFIGVKTDGTPVYYDGSHRTLIHSGNIGSQFVEGIGTAYANQSINFGKEGKVRMIYGTVSNATSLGYPRQYTSGLSVLTGYTGWQMVTYGGTSIPNPYFRSLLDNGTFSDWKQLAFLTDNVASATKLATARTIWGQSFDGTGNIDGNLVQSIDAYGTSPTIYHKVHGSTANRYCALKFRFNAYDYFAGLDIESNNGVLATINSSGNVTIGSSDLAGTSAKLYVDGNIKLGASGYLYKNSNTVIDFSGDDSPLFGYGTAKAGKATWLSGNTINITYGTSLATAMFVNASGNVLIGTTTDTSGNKLQVNGTILSTPARESAYSSVLRGYQSGIVAGDRLSLVIGKESTSKNAAYFGFTYDGSGSSKNFASIGFHSVDNILCVAATSYVGIGTTTPEHKLHVNGNVAAIATDATPRSFRAINTNGTISLLTSTSRGVYDSTNSRWLIGTNGTNSFLLCGNVGIGTDAPTYKLDVNGSMNVFASGATARHIHVTNSVGKMSLHVAASGKRGLYDSTIDNWMIYTDSTSVYFPSKPLSITHAVTMSSTLSVSGLLTANSGVKVASGQALTFLDASGKEHKLTYDSTAGAFKFDGNILVLGDGQFNAIN